MVLISTTYNHDAGIIRNVPGLGPRIGYRGGDGGECKIKQYIDESHGTSTNDNPTFVSFRTKVKRTTHKVVMCSAVENEDVDLPTRAVEDKMETSSRVVGKTRRKRQEFLYGLEIRSSRCTVMIMTHETVVTTVESSIKRSQRRNAYIITLSMLANEAAIIRTVVGC